MVFDIPPYTIDLLNSPLLDKKELQLSVLRLDLLHPVISGNKLFKLYYFIKAALAEPHQPIITFGGAWSNHLVATAYACSVSGLQSIGIVRGERPVILSSTLKACEQYGMQLQFISRADYRKKEYPLFLGELHKRYGAHLLIPEGGYHTMGVKGAALILERLPVNHYSHICIATGTATTLAGLLSVSRDDQQVIGINVLKGPSDIKERVTLVTGSSYPGDRLNTWQGYHFGGYAKHNPALIGHMNEIWLQHHLPTDIVYTGKAMYGVLDQAGSGYFNAGSNILFIHTGGLQGNGSLPAGTLLF